MLLTIIKALYVIPGLGGFLRKAFEESDNALLALIGLVAVAAVAIVVVFGYPGLISVALTAVVVMFVIILDIARG